MDEESFCSTEIAAKTRLARAKRVSRYVVNVFRKEWVCISWAGLVVLVGWLLVCGMVVVAYVKLWFFLWD